MPGKLNWQLIDQKNTWDSLYFINVMNTFSSLPVIFYTYNSSHKGTYFTCIRYMQTHTCVYSVDCLDFKVPYVYWCIYNSTDHVYPYTHGDENNQQQNIRNAVRRMRSGRDAWRHPCDIKYTHKYDWRKRT